MPDVKYMVFAGSDEATIFDIMEDCVVEEVALNVGHDPEIGAVVLATRDGLSDLIDSARQRGLRVGRYSNIEKAIDMLRKSLGLR